MKNEIVEGRIELGTQNGVNKWTATTIESGTQYINILQSFVFSPESNMVSSVLSVL